MAARNLRIKIPKKAPDLIELAKLILAKHAADGASSVLNSIDMTDFANKSATADTEHKRMTKLKRDSEIATENRNLALGFSKGQGSEPDGSVVFFTKTCRDILKGIYKGREHELGDWGFEVNTTPKHKKENEK